MSLIDKNMSKIKKKKKMKKEYSATKEDKQP